MIATKPLPQTESPKPSTRYSPDNPPPAWIWNPDGYGFLGSVDDHGVYDQNYFEKYRGYAQTEQGQKITQMRASFVEKWMEPGHVLDIGIGSGSFVSEMNLNRLINTHGDDINQIARSWLESHFWNRRHWIAYQNVTFWDSMEHIRDLDSFLNSLHGAKRIFVSMPIYTDEEDALSSKHFRPDEHWWYFTAEGLRLFLSRHGYDLLAQDDFETLECGRESIGTFAFRRALTR